MELPRPNVMSLDMLCSETMTPRCLVSSPSPVPTEFWKEEEYDDFEKSFAISHNNNDNAEIPDQTVSVDPTPSVKQTEVTKDAPDDIEETAVVGGNTDIVFYASDTIYLLPNNYFRAEYMCSICQTTHHVLSNVVPDKFDPTSLSFKFGSPRPLFAVPPCTYSPKFSQPLRIQLSFKLWQRTGCNVVRLGQDSLPLNDTVVKAAGGGGGSAAAIEAEIDAPSSIVTTPVGSKRPSSESLGAPQRRRRGSPPLSDRAHKVKTVLSHNFDDIVSVRGVGERSGDAQ